MPRAACFPRFYAVGLGVRLRTPVWRRTARFGLSRATEHGMLFDHICRKCGSANLSRSRIRHVREGIASPLFTMYRCMTCDLRQAKFRAVRVGPDRAREKTVYGVWKRS